LPSQLLNAKGGFPPKWIPDKVPMGTKHEAALAIGAEQMAVLPAHDWIRGIGAEWADSGWVKNFSTHDRQSIHND
jgi:hypothetical protein